MDYSKNIAKQRQQQRFNLELKLKNFESNLNSEENRTLYKHYKNDLENSILQNSSKTNVKKQEFLNTLNTKTLTNQQSDRCKNEIRETIYLIL